MCVLGDGIFEDGGDADLPRRLGVRREEEVEVVEDASMSGEVVGAVADLGCRCVGHRAPRDGACWFVKLEVAQQWAEPGVRQLELSKLLVIGETDSGLGGGQGGRRGELVVPRRFCRARTVAPPPG